MQESKNEVITTPSGYKFTIKTELNYGEYLEIQRVYSRYVNVDAKNESIGNVSASASLEAMQKALDILVISAEKDGVAIQNPIESINRMSINDAMPIVTRVNQILVEAVNPEKKVV